MAEILVDSSVWISAKERSSRLYWVLSKLLMSDSDEVLTTGLIQLEVTQGARTESIQKALWNGFEGLKRVDLSKEIYRKSSYYFMRCKKEGITPTTIDCLLCTLAAEHNLLFWTLDMNIKRMSRIIGFQLFNGKK